MGEATGYTSYCTSGVEGGEEDAEEDVNLVPEVESMVGGEDAVIVSGRKCKCGSTSHQWTSNHSCLLNKKNPKKEHLDDTRLLLVKTERTESVLQQI